MDVIHKGGCHCGKVRFEVTAPSNLICINCNCSICQKKQNRHFIVPKSKFHLVQGNEFLTIYTFNTHKAKHQFCKICGVQSFYIPRSNQDGVGIMPHCLDEGTVNNITVENFDGSQWENSIETEKGQFVRNMSKRDMLA